MYTNDEIMSLLNVLYKKYFVTEVNYSSSLNIRILQLLQRQKLDTNFYCLLIAIAFLIASISISASISFQDFSDLVLYYHRDMS